MVLLQSNPGEIGSVAVDFNLKGVDGKIYSLDTFAQKSVIVLIFRYSSLLGIIWSI